jgi:hypothetical protein
MVIKLLGVTLTPVLGIFEEEDDDWHEDESSISEFSFSRSWSWTWFSDPMDQNFWDFLEAIQSL